ncbi:hypothetical protein HWV62_23418 [Athelia sp. TMB]|nr:hypothetical protein HWV62_23418 [Athelia sp. TMB]
MISLCRANCIVVHLKEDNDLQLPWSQRGMRGHVIIFPQRPSKIAQLLPPSMDDIITPICVMFTGSEPPTKEWIEEKATPLIVRREKVRAALQWLKLHNPLYKDVVLNHGLLDGLAERQVLPVQVDHMMPSESTSVLTSGYTPSVGVDSVFSAQDIRGMDQEEIFNSVVVMDVDANAPSNELKAAAMRHIKKDGGRSLEIPHDPIPCSEYDRPNLFPMVYPTLFPYGLGGFEDLRRSPKISFQRHVKHLLSLKDRRFQEHYSFQFVAFNIMQRRTLLLRTNLKVKRSAFENAAKGFASVTAEAIGAVSKRIAGGDFRTYNNEAERKVVKNGDAKRDTRNDDGQGNAQFLHHYQSGGHIKPDS